MRSPYNVIGPLKTKGKQPQLYVRYNGKMKHPCPQEPHILIRTTQFIHISKYKRWNGRSGKTLLRRCHLSWILKVARDAMRQRCEGSELQAGEAPCEKPEGWLEGMSQMGNIEPASLSERQCIMGINIY